MSHVTHPSPTLGRRIRTARHTRGLSQVELAAELGVSQVAISSWERDERIPSVSNLRRLARGLRIPFIELAEILDGDGVGDEQG